MRLYVHIGSQIHPQTANDDQKIGQFLKQLCDSFNYQELQISKYPGGKEINPNIKLSTFFSNMDDVWVVKTEEKKSQSLIVPEVLQYQSLSKYSFYEYDSNWVRVEVPFPSIGKHDKGKISCNFDTNSLILKINDYQQKNYQFSVLRLQCNIQPDHCKYSVLSDKIRISLRKVKDTDNWFALFKTKTIGGDD